TQSVRYSSTMDELGFSILRNSTSRDDFARLLVHELDQGKLAWQKRILKHASSMVTVDGLQELEAILQRHYPNTSVTVLPNQKGCSINGFVPSGNDVEHILALAEQYFQPVVNRLTVSGENSNPPESNVNKEEPTSSTASQDYLPIIEWIEHKVINAGQDDELLRVCADYYWELISHAYTDEAIKLSLLQKLAGCQALGPEFWLAVKRLGDTQQSWQQPWQSTGPHSTLHPAARMEIEKQAIATLAMPEGRSPFQVQAAIILRQRFSKNFDRHGMADTRAVLLEQIRSLLRRLGNTQHELMAADAIPNSLVNMTALVNEINSQSKLEILKPSGELRYYSWVIGRFSPAQSFLTIELLELIRTMDASSEFSSELLKLYKTTAELNDQLSAILDTNPINEVMWPGLVSKPASPATTDQWIAGLIRARAFRLLALETQAELTQLANRTFQSRAFESLLDKYDLNKDRVLSVKEASNLPESSLPAPSENLDLNGNGTLEEIELKDLLLRLGSQPALGKVQAVAPNDVVQQWSIKQIEKFDRNKDGRLTADEWRVMIIKIDDADTNADGVITAEELAIFRSRKQ
ncbi:MAG: EF-hand domain-containing protein, partial [Pirellulaceae bacterium]|nr:EF-hand domain-containing protein [Pirellulaceae bacterium]